MDRKCFIFFVRADNDFILVWESTDSLVLLWVVEISLSSVEKIELRLIWAQEWNLLGCSVVKVDLFSVWGIRIDFDLNVEIGIDLILGGVRK